jgi:hypothetical protein
LRPNLMQFLRQPPDVSAPIDETLKELYTLASHT